MAHKLLLGYTLGVTVRLTRMLARVYTSWLVHLHILLVVVLAGVAFHFGDTAYAHLDGVQPEAVPPN